MKIELECLYCGHKWIETAYNVRYLADKRCPICNDRNLKHRDTSQQSIDYYKGCPPFEDDKEDNPYGYDIGVD